METIGQSNIVAFSIGDDDGNGELRSIQIHLVGQVVAADTSAFVPGLLGGLIPELRRLEHRLNFLEDEAILASARDVTAAHNSLVHGNADIFTDEAKHERVATRNAFLDLGIPETDGFCSFLIPWCGRLYLTQQVWSQSDGGYHYLETVAGVEVTPYLLISVLRDVVKELRRSG